MSNKHKDTTGGEVEEKLNPEEMGQDSSIEEKQAEVVNYEDKYLRALADYQNLLRQTAKEKEDFSRYANEQLIHGLLPVFDNLKISLKHIDEAAEKSGWGEGIKYVVKQFADTLESFGVKEIKTHNHKFDHHKMEAVSEKETDDEKLADHVAEELTTGYLMKDKVIRAARVSVYKLK
jgi:molecular chaperone GrpE